MAVARRRRFQARRPAPHLPQIRFSFDLRREELEAAFRDPKSDYYLDRAGYKIDADYARAVRDELEDRDYFTEKNVFWVPPLARWKTIQENAALASDTAMALDGSTCTLSARSSTECSATHKNPARSPPYATPCYERS